MRSMPLFAAMMMAGCMEGGETTPPPVGMANPASAFCVEQGGTVEIRTEAAGQVGYCTLPDGRVIEEWALFRAEGPKP